MKFAEYQEKAFSFCTPACYTRAYLDLGYVSEIGELAGKLAKRIRGDIVTDTDIMQEIGDCSWMAAVRERLQDRKLNDWRCYPYQLTSELEGINDLLKVSDCSSFYAVRLFCEYLGFDFNECLMMNLEKLSDRQKRCVIQGNGDNR
jgi:NTP pyrophosphatase (non-canonical NTP hydrolase)